VLGSNNGAREYDEHGYSASFHDVLLKAPLRAFADCLPRSGGHKLSVVPERQAESIQHRQTVRSGSGVQQRGGYDEEAARQL
jgi:hypothetical protein